ncbi:HupE/UreJ family protein [Nitrospina watsonii]|uniref:HupE/UreJ family protein n=1 Tax=Nitrospina watsonii TaxID=1323948 RepID=A0ABN8W029_9BACT|nr:HupE/UreJ family protein [Nitrospina watsonii]
MLAASKTGLSLCACLLGILATQSAFAHGMSEAEKNAIIEGGNLQFMWLGASHMLTGFDHLLFVFGFVFFLTTFKDVVKYVTAFTLGHSITLVTATLWGITANYYLIDAVIALSVCYIGFENIGGFRKYFETSPNVLWAIFLFGFIHGFGLSTRLQELPLGDEGILLKILSFNLGIELGQIGALGIMLALLYKWRRTHSFLQISEVSNRGVIAAGVFFFMMQMHGYSHTVNPDEFGFPADSHLHAHEEMTTPSQPAFPGSEYLMDLETGPLPAP